MSREELIEKLAAIEHERWSDWQKYMFSLCRHQDSGRGVGKAPDLVIPGELVDHWQRQINTPYAELSEKEKDSDREQVDRYLALLDTYTEQREREARIDELKKAPIFGAYWLQKFEDGSDTPNEYVKARLKELQQESFSQQVTRKNREIKEEKSS